MTTHVQETAALPDVRAQLEGAQRAKAEIEARISGLEAQVSAGAAEAAERQLAEEYAQLRLTQLREEAAEERVRAAEAAAVAERRREAEAAAIADLEILGVGRLAEALDTAVSALQELKRLGDARQAALERHARAFIDLGMDDKIRHRDGRWIVFEAGGVKYDTAQDNCQGARLVELAQKELAHREQNVRYQAQGFNPLAPLAHPVTRHLAERAG
ncbi:hypothetical protein ACSR0Z_22120 [Streptomyces viridosporus]